MSNIDKIRQEIKGRAKFHDDAMKACVGLNNIALTHSAGWKEDTELLAFIDSLSEEKPSEDLEEAATELYPVKLGQETIVGDLNKLSREGFKAGAEWQKEQMMKDAVEGEIVKDISNKLAVTAKNVNLDGFKFGDKVKIIIVKKKEEETLDEP